MEKEKTLQMSYLQGFSSICIVFWRREGDWPTSLCSLPFPLPSGGVLAQKTKPNQRRTFDGVLLCKQALGFVSKLPTQAHLHKKKLHHDAAFRLLRLVFLAEGGAPEPIVFLSLI